MVVHFYNPSTWEAEEEDLHFEASLGYIVSSRKFFTSCQIESREQVRV
jgi:hypothetical protein